MEKDTINNQTAVKNGESKIAAKQADPKFRSTEERAAYEESVKEYGDLSDEKGKLNIAAAAKFLAILWQDDIMFCKSEDAFFRKDAKSGLWEKIDRSKLSVEIVSFLIKFGRDVLEIQRIGFGVGNSTAKNIITFLQEFLGKDDFFLRRRGEFVLHIKNGFLVFDKGKKKLIFHNLSDKALAKSIRSRKQLNITYDEKAQCPRFMELLNRQMSEDERNVFLTYVGMCLLGINIAQKILMIVGCAGGGKTTAVNIVEQMLGYENVAEFRTSCGTGQFEATHYIGKCLLCAKDATADFLKMKYASSLKALSGNDRIDTESKHSNSVGHIDGGFCIIIASNCNQLVQIASDRDAWARRLLIIRFKGEKPQNPIPDFDKILVEEEGPGILNAVLPYLEKLLADNGAFHVSAEQEQAIANLLDESEGIKFFVQDCLETVDAKDLTDQASFDVSTEEAYFAYVEFCKKRNWSAETLSRFQKALPDHMAAIHKKTQSHDLKRNGKSTVRGYRGVRVKGIQVQTGNPAQ